MGERSGGHWDTERGTAGKSQQSKKSLILARGNPTLDSPGLTSMLDLLPAGGYESILSHVLPQKVTAEIINCAN